MGYGGFCKFLRNFLGDFCGILIEVSYVRICFKVFVY